MGKWKLSLNSPEYCKSFFILDFHLNFHHISGSNLLSFDLDTPNNVNCITRPIFLDLL